MERSRTQAVSQARRLLITADGGQSLGSRMRLWKWELQQLADEIGVAITVCHFPPVSSRSRIALWAVEVGLVKDGS